MPSFRPDKLGSLIRNIVGDVIAHKLQDPRVSPLTSVTRVEVSGDLQHAKVFVSVMGEAGEQNRTMMGLNHARGHIQRIVARQVTARICPKIRFVVDESIKDSARIIKIIQDSLETHPGDFAEGEPRMDRQEDPDAEPGEIGPDVATGRPGASTPQVAGASGPDERGNDRRSDDSEIVDRLD